MHKTMISVLMILGVNQLYAIHTKAMIVIGVPVFVQNVQINQIYQNVDLHISEII